MEKAAEALNAVNARLVALTWRGVRVSLLTAVGSGLSLTISWYHRPFSWTGAFWGMIIACTGYQLHLADGQFDRLSSRRGHAWVRPLAFGLLVTGIVLFTLGVLALAHRVAVA